MVVLSWTGSQFYLTQLNKYLNSLFIEQINVKQFKHSFNLQLFYQWGFWIGWGVTMLFLCWQYRPLPVT